MRALTTGGNTAFDLSDKSFGMSHVWTHFLMDSLIKERIRQRKLPII